MPSLITFDGVVAGYGSLPVLDALTLDARAGDITLLIGPNGAGKSTVLKTFFGLLRVTAGKIGFRGRDITDARPADLLRDGVAFVPQGRNLFPVLSVLHNLELGATMLTRAEREERMREVLGRFPQLRERVHAQAATLSGGEQKQLEIARALLLRPQVMLIDEPSIGLAPIVSRIVFALLRTLADAGTTVVMVEQNVRSALAVADRVLLLEGGRLRRDSPAAGLLDDPDLNRVFLGQLAARPPP